MNENQSKALQRSDGEHRVKPYMDWRRTIKRGLYMLDVDDIEWRYRNGKQVAVGVLEMTRVDGDKPVGEGYFQAVLNRFLNRDMQGKTTKIIAEALGTHAYIVIFRYNCSEFFVYNLTLEGAWVTYNEKQFIEFLDAL